jgi:Adenylylsulphate kinase
MSPPGPAASSPSAVLIIGGRSGAGKTSVAAELHRRLADRGVWHCVIEGDNLDLAYPAPWQRGLALAESNLQFMWHGYREAGYHRLIYTNTVSVREDVLPNLLAAIGGDPTIHGVLLTAEPATAADRLRGREIGGGLDDHVDRGIRSATELEASTPPWVWRIPTDGRTVVEIAAQIESRLGWTPLEGPDRP